MASSSVALFFTSVTLTFPAISLASNVVYNFQCDKTGCPSLSSADCPQWHYCDTHARLCEPCTPCVDASDADKAVDNCHDPLFCIHSLYANQDPDSACPKLRIAEGNSCWGKCNSCGGTFGSYLGTTCRAECQNGDREVLSCVFLNKRAQWNVSREPYWIIYETLTPPPSKSPPPPPPSTPSAVFSVPGRGSLHSVTHGGLLIPPFFTSTMQQVYDLETLIGIIVGTVLGVAVILVVAFIFVYHWHQKNKKQPKGPEEEPLNVSLEPTPQAKEVPVPVEHSDDSESEPMAARSSGRQPVEMGSSINCSLDMSHSPRQPIEISDYGSYPFAQTSLPSAPLQTSDKLCRLSPLSASPSVLSLHSDGSIRQPQEDSAPLVDSPPVGYSDSGHPPYRCSSSSSLQHETSHISEVDLDGRFVREATENSQETSSGFHPRESSPELNSSFHIRQSSD